MNPTHIVLPTNKYSDALMIRTNDFIFMNKLESSSNYLNRHESFTLIVEIIKELLDRHTLWVKNKSLAFSAFKTKLSWFDEELSDLLTCNYYTQVLSNIEAMLEQLLRNYVNLGPNYDIWEIKQCGADIAVLCYLGDYRIEEFYAQNPEAKRI